MGFAQPSFGQSRKTYGLLAAVTFVVSAEARIDLSCDAANVFGIRRPPTRWLPPLDSCPYVGRRKQQRHALPAAPVLPQEL
jgi:hypothetical protein